MAAQWREGCGAGAVETEGPFRRRCSLWGEARPLASHPRNVSTIAVKLLDAAASWPPWAAHSVQGDEEGARGLLKNLLVPGFHTGSKEQAGGF